MSMLWERFPLLGRIVVAAIVLLLLIVSGTLNVSLGTDPDPGTVFQCSFSVNNREQTP